MPTPSINDQMLTAVAHLHLNDLARLAQAHPDWADHPRDQDDPLLSVLTTCAAPGQHAWRNAMAQTLIAPLAAHAEAGPARPVHESGYSEYRVEGGKSVRFML